VAPRFPQADTAEAFRDLSREDPALAAAAAALWRELRLPAPALFASGSLPVYAVGDDLVLKLYPPCYAGERDHERAVLERLRGALPCATPEVLSSGEVEAWRYVLMTRVRGRPLDENWTELRPADRLRLAAQVGAALAALHRVDAPGLADPVAPWDGFIREQARRCVELQRGRGLDERWLEQIPDFLREVGLPTADPPALLHTEIMRTHVFAERAGDGCWSVSGLVDFEPAMRGATDYEFASVGLFLTRGSGAALRSLLLAYGLREADLGLPLQRRFLVCTLLHRYSNLAAYLELLPPGGGARTLDDLASRWWAVGDEPELAAGKGTA
jgi:hygromycin-B 7''-O-kinase